MAITLNDLQDNEAEKSILRLLINKISLMAVVNDRLVAKDFYGATHQIIFQALREMFDANKDVDLVSLANHLTVTGQMDNIGGITYLTALFNGVIHESGLDGYIDIVRENSQRRYFYKCCDAAAKRVHDKTFSIEEMVGKMGDVLENLQPVAKEDKQESLIHAYESFTENAPQGLDTGYKELDHILNGLKKGNLVVLAARPAMGKTTLALNFIANLCKQGKKVVLYSLEMTSDEIYSKLISCVSKISKNDAKLQIVKDNQTKNTNLSEDAKTFRQRESKAFWSRLQYGCDAVSKWNLEIIDRGSFEISDIRIAAKVWKKKDGLDLLVIDYLQLMSARGNDNRTAEVTAITKGLKNLAKELDVPILALSQLNRSVEKQTNKRPSMSDLRESGSIEQDADVVMLIYRDNYYNKNGDQWTEIIVDKNRNGGTSIARLEFLPAISKFEEFRGIPGQSVSRKTVDEVFDKNV